MDDKKIWELYDGITALMGTTFKDKFGPSEQSILMLVFLKVIVGSHIFLGGTRKQLNDLQLAVMNGMKELYEELITEKEDKEKK